MKNHAEINQKKENPPSGSFSENWNPMLNWDSFDVLTFDSPDALRHLMDEFCEKSGIGYCAIVLKNKMQNEVCYVIDCQDEHLDFQKLKNRNRQVETNIFSASDMEKINLPDWVSQTVIKNFLHQDEYDGYLLFGIDQEEYRVYEPAIRSLKKFFKKRVGLSLILQYEKKQREKYEFLYQVSDALRNASRFKEIISIITGQLRKHFNLAICSYVWSSGGVLWFQNERVPKKRMLADLRKSDLNINFQPILDQVFHAYPVLEDQQLYELFFMRLKSVYFIPIRRDNTFLGKIIVGYKSVRNLTSEEREILEAVAEMAASAILRKTMAEKFSARIAHRNSELFVLYSITRLITSMENIESFLSSTALILKNETDCQAVLIYLASKESILLAAVQGEALLDTEESELRHKLTFAGEKNRRGKIRIEMGIGYREFVFASMIGQKGFIGVIAISADGKTQSPFVNDSALLLKIASHAAIGIDDANRRLNEKNTILLEERQRMARDLHDSISQLMYSQRLFAQAGQSAIENRDLEHLKIYLDRLTNITDQAYRELRLMIYSLRPTQLGNGFANAIKNRLEMVESRIGINFITRINDKIQLSSDFEQAIFRIAEEAGNNVVKHSSAKKLEVFLDVEKDELVLMIKDDGIGFDSEEISRGLGFESMFERSEQFDGTLYIESSPGNGTKILVRFKEGKGWVFE